MANPSVPVVLAITAARNSLQILRASISRPGTLVVIQVTTKQGPTGTADIPPIVKWHNSLGWSRRFPTLGNLGGPQSLRSILADLHESTTVISPTSNMGINIEGMDAGDVSRSLGRLKRTLQSLRQIHEQRGLSGGFIALLHLSDARSRAISGLQQRKVSLDIVDSPLIALEDALNIYKHDGLLNLELWFDAACMAVFARREYITVVHMALTRRQPRSLPVDIARRIISTICQASRAV